jgi:hypothetical protein
MGRGLQVLIGLLVAYLIFVKFPNEVGGILVNVGQALQGIGDH